MLEENLEASMFFLQLPANLPMVKPSPKAEGQEMAGNSKPPKGARPTEKACSLDELPAGFMGKMLIYSSGVVKLKLGDTIYDVRRIWDQYIRPGGSCIPGHWVRPPPPADEIWASYLVQPK